MRQSFAIGIGGAAGQGVATSQRYSVDAASRLQSDSAMHPGRIAELLEPFLTASADIPITNVRSFEASQRRGETQGLPLSLPKGSAVLSAIQLQSISTYVDILTRWNARINLTAIR